MGGVRDPFTVKDPDEVAVPPGVVTVIGFVPGLVPLGTVVVIWVSLFTVRASWVVPLNATPVAPVNPDPVITTEVPITPLVGLKLEIAGCTVNDVEEVAVPPGVVTMIGPVVAPAGTVVVIWASLSTE